MASETEKYLLKKLDEAQPKAQESEDCLSKVFLNIQRHFENVISLIRGAKNGTAGESSRRGDLYYLLNALAHWQMVLERKNVYSPEGIRFAVALSNKLKKMESRYKGEKSTTGGRGDLERENVGGQNKISSINDESYDRTSYRTVDRNRVFGFSEKEDFMERFLIRRDNEVNGFKAICISGVAGVGKTTLCQLAFNNEQVANNFFPRIWVCMPKAIVDDDVCMPKAIVDDDSYKEEVLKRMLKCLGVEDQVIKFTVKNRGLLGLLFALRSVLKGRRYLIVLDDTVHSNDFFNNILDTELDDNHWNGRRDCDNHTEKLALGLPKRQGGAVIVTTRSKELAKGMVGEENVYPLLPLNDKSCGEILKDSGGEKVKQLLKDETDHDLEDTMRKLGGLPLAAKIMGEIMKEQLDKMPANN